MHTYGLIEEPRTTGFLTQITAYGIDSIEDKRTAEDVEIRKKLLETLEKEFGKDPRRAVDKSKLNEDLEYSEVEILRNIWYLERKGFVDVEWYLGGEFLAKITSVGIEALKEPSALDNEIRVMSNAYAMLYNLENSLRIFVEKKLRDRFRDQWWERGVTQKDIRQQAEERKIPEPDSNLSLINYTEFRDLRRIVNKNWEIFRDTFQRQSGIVSRIEELESIRNTIAHTRLLSNDDLAKLELFSKEIASTIY